MSGCRWVVKRRQPMWSNMWFSGECGPPFPSIRWAYRREEAREFTDLAEARTVAKRNAGCKVYRVRGT